MTIIRCLMTMSIACVTALHGQTGSINNTLGTGGVFRVKGAASDSLLVVKENGKVGVGTSDPVGTFDVAGQLTAQGLKVKDVPSFFVTHVEETGLDNQPSVLSTWSESPTGAHDNSGSFNTSTGEFIAPRDGFYLFTAYIEVSGAGTLGLRLLIKVGSSYSDLQAWAPTPGSYASVQVSGVLKVTSGTTVTAVIAKPGSSGATIAGTGYFSGFLISDF